MIPFANIGWTTGLVAGAMVLLVALFGDLPLSLMMRHVGVKDSSHLFPGHGGFLDRSDSLLLVSVVICYYAKSFSNVTS